MLHSVLTICEPIAPHPLLNCGERYSHLDGLEFADQTEGVQELCVDILVGLDHYWDLFTGSVQRGTQAPVAID